MESVSHNIQDKGSSKSFAARCLMTLATEPFMFSPGSECCCVFIITFMKEQTEQVNGTLWASLNCPKGELRDLRVGSEFNACVSLMIQYRYNVSQQ